MDITKTILRWLGSPVPEELKVSGWQLAFEGIGWMWALALAAVCLGSVFLTYQTQPNLARSRAVGLMCLRTALFATLVFLLLQPVLLILQETFVRTTMVLLVDASTSMTVQDQRTDKPDQVRAALAFGTADPEGGLQQSAGSLPKAAAPPSREGILRALFANGRMNLLNRLAQKSDIEVYALGRDASDTGVSVRAAPESLTQPPPDLLKNIKFDRSSTALGDAVRTVLEQKRGQALAGIFLLTDGTSNAGMSPVEAATLAAQDGVPVFTYGVGVTAPHDALIAAIEAPDSIFLKDRADIKVRVRAQNMKGSKGVLVLKMGDKEIGRAEVNYNQTEEQIFPFSVTAEAKGDFDLRADLSFSPDEANRDNNVASRHVRVVDRRLSVLLVESQPRWEFRYLSTLLARDRRMNMKCVLLDADESLGADPENSIYLPSLPAEEAQLLEYDAVILGDIDVSRLPDAFVQGLIKLISKNSGALVLLAGPQSMPASLKGTPLEALCPVDLGSAAPISSEDSTNSGDVTPPPVLPLIATAAGLESPMLQLSDNPAENGAIWQKFRGVTWVAPDAKAKLTAEILLTAGLDGPPALVLQSYGSGQVAYIGTDQFYKIRQGYGELYHTRLWDQILLKLGARRMQSEAGLVQLTVDKRVFAPGEKISIAGRIFNPGFLPRTDPSINAILQYQELDSSGKPVGEKQKRTFMLNMKADDAGAYSGDFFPLNNGSYELLVGVPKEGGGEPELMTALDFRVTEPSLEFADIAMNESLLMKMAEAGKGRFFREETLAGLPDLIKPRAEPVAAPIRVDIVHHWIWFALIVLLATTEWILRKVWQLK